MMGARGGGVGGEALRDVRVAHDPAFVEASRPTPRPRQARGGWALDVAIAALLTAWYYRYGLGRLHDHLYDMYDQRAMVWLMEWLYHSFFGTGSIAGVFDANILYPNRNVLAWSDTMMGFLPVYSVFRAITHHPILSINCTAITGVLASALGMLRLGRELTGRTSVIAAAVGAVGLLAASVEAHLQLKSVALVVWALLLIVRFVRGSGRAFPWCIVVLSWLFLCSIYYSVMLAVLVVSAAAVALAVGRGRVVAWARDAARTIPVVPSIVAAVPSLLCVAWVGRHYLQVKGEFGSYQLSGFVTYSARWGSFFDAPSSSLVYRTAYGDWGSHAARLCVGVLVWAAVAALLLGWRRWQMAPRDRAIVALFAFAAALGMALALGPYARDAFARGVRIPLLAYPYAKLFPGFGALRTIGRFGVLAAVFMAVLAELGVRQVLAAVTAPSGGGRAAYAVLALLFTTEQTTILEPFRMEAVPRRAVYEAIRDRTPAQAVVLELPVVKPDFFQTLSWFHDQMIGSTVHWRRIPAGFTSHESPELDRLRDAYQGMERDPAGVGRFLDVVRQLGITHVVVDDALVPAPVAERARRALEAAGYARADVLPRVSIFAAPAAAAR